MCKVQRSWSLDHTISVSIEVDQHSRLLEPHHWPQQFQVVSAQREYTMPSILPLFPIQYERFASSHHCTHLPTNWAWVEWKFEQGVFVDSMLHSKGKDVRNRTGSIRIARPSNILPEQSRLGFYFAVKEWTFLWTQKDEWIGWACNTARNTCIYWGRKWRWHKKRTSLFVRTIRRFQRSCRRLKWYHRDCWIGLVRWPHCCLESIFLSVLQVLILEIDAVVNHLLVHCCPSSIVHHRVVDSRFIISRWRHRSIVQRTGAIENVPIIIENLRRGRSRTRTMTNFEINAVNQYLYEYSSRYCRRD